MNQNQRPPHAVNVVTPGASGRVMCVDTTQVRKKHDPERYFRRMVWRQAGFTHSGLLVWYTKRQPAVALPVFLFPVVSEAQA
jgi:hypothetical protein